LEQGDNHEAKFIQATIIGKGRGAAKKLMKKAGVNAREASGEPIRDVGDESVIDELRVEQFTEADSDWIVLGQVREALGRIQNGTFGKCLADAEPIEEKRLKAILWTSYCKLNEEMRTSHLPKL
jgi:DnaK suppressor protein